MRRKILIIAVMAIIVSPVFGEIYCNDIPPDPKKLELQSKINARVLYFEGMAGLNQFFKNIEQNGIVVADISYLEAAARQNFIKSIELFQVEADGLSLSDEQRTKYMSYDYSKVESDQKYHKKLMDTVISFFKNGDIKGFYVQLILNLRSMVEAIDNVTQNPSLANILRLEEVTGNTQAYGLYGTILSYKVFRVID